MLWSEESVRKALWSSWVPSFVFEFLFCWVHHSAMLMMFQQCGRWNVFKRDRALALAEQKPNACELNTQNIEAKRALLYQYTVCFGFLDVCLTRHCCWKESHSVSDQLRMPSASGLLISYHLMFSDANNAGGCHTWRSLAMFVTLRILAPLFDIGHCSNSIRSCDHMSL